MCYPMPRRCSVVHQVIGNRMGVAWEISRDSQTFFRPCSMVKFENPTELRCERMEVSADDGKKPTKIRSSLLGKTYTNTICRWNHPIELSNYHLEDFTHWAFYPETFHGNCPAWNKESSWKKMQCQKGIFRWLVAGSLPRKWPGLLRFSLRDNRALFCFIMSACFINCEMVKITNNANHKQYTCPSSEGNHWWIAAYHKAVLKISTCRSRSLCSCQSVGSTPTTNPLGVLRDLGVMGGDAGSSLGRLFEEVVRIFYVLLFFLKEILWLDLYLSENIIFILIDPLSIFKNLSCKSLDLEISIFRWVGYLGYGGHFGFTGRLSMSPDSQVVPRPLAVSSKSLPFKKGYTVSPVLFFPMVFSVICWSLYPEVRLIHYKLFQKLWL